MAERCHRPGPLRCPGDGRPVQRRIGLAAVGFLCWAAASDLEARAKTYADMHRFLAAQATRLASAGAAREFVQLVRGTELRILDGNLGWFSRRLFSGVS